MVVTALNSTDLTLDDTTGGQSYNDADESSFMKDLTSQLASRLD